MPTEKVNGVNIYYELTGAKGDALVLVHGSWGDHHNWDMVVGEFAKTFRVLTYDRRGHSQSERLSGQGLVTEDVDDLIALVEHLEIFPAHIVGNSYGAGIVLQPPPGVPTFSEVSWSTNPRCLACWQVTPMPRRPWIL